ncbi:hopanoid biosynthesis associated protein HpnK [Rhizomicrobium palustre]|uniref:Hopanoid biosynthesis associated protein HpnK n=1 Tax=Rhizomicrobium palustre TaxID=189966 RepID=A0A846MZQ6_9PROT|nr:hopanoid biosynthesis-associated protein HpnK [Rhizomicrobium palustre]NIK88793.1 hopanoid biosynthesis associated protein HpnK [Rhizomicrobium palustre]
MQVAESSRKALIVTADDFGAAPEVNEAVIRANREGILTAASLMVAAPGAADAVARAKDNPRLGVGLHLVLVEGKPVLPTSQIPDLVGPDGNFRTDMVKASFAMAFLPKMRRQLAAEIEAQFDAFASTGLTLDHVNAHKHFHLHPIIAKLVVKIGKSYGMRAARAPVEPMEILQKIQPDLRGGEIERFVGKRLKERLSRAGIFTPDYVFGLAWTGAMNTRRVGALIDRLPDGVSEIYVHPAISAYPGSAPGYRYSEEFAALMAPEVLARMKNVALGSFEHFQKQAQS